jgi:hypothetical protein
MINGNSYSSELGQVNRLALAVVGFALFAIVMSGAVAVLTKSEAATPEISATATASNEPFVYFPAQYVNQATEIEPMPPTF